MPSGQIDEHNSDEDKIKDTALREVREETGYELAPNGELISLGYFFSSPGFTDERGYFFLARPVQPCAEGPDRDEGESILDCRGFNSEEIRRMIAENEIRDANTLGICATLSARGLLSLARAKLPVRWRSETSSNFVIRRRAKHPNRFSSIWKTCAGPS